jgi:hypothetical protein
VLAERFDYLLNTRPRQAACAHVVRSVRTSRPRASGEDKSIGRYSQCVGRRVHAKQRAHAKCAGLPTAQPEEKSGHVNLWEGVMRGAVRRARTRMYGAGRSHVLCSTSMAPNGLGQQHSRVISHHTNPFLHTITRVSHPMYSNTIGWRSTTMLHLRVLNSYPRAQLQSCL